MSCISLVIKRSISTSSIRNGKRNFKKFPIYNKRGTREFKQRRAQDPNFDIPIDKRGVRDVGYQDGEKFVVIPEMVPELIVPNLKDFKLKPYVSYRTPDVVQTEFTAKDLFSVVYAPKIAKDYKEGKLLDDGTPIESTPEEKMTPEEAKIKARQSGSDIF